MERRKFIKYSSLAGIGAGLFPAAALGNIGASTTAKFVQFSVASTQIRHGALNIPFAKFLKAELPFDWLIDVHQNIFFKDGFQRNEAEDLNVMSIALKEEDHFEALQIDIQTHEINFLWKDQMVSANTDDTLQTINISDEDYKFSLLCLDADEVFDLEQQEGKEYFIQVLDGEVDNKENRLTTSSGLGLVGMGKSKLRLESKKLVSKALIIERAL